MPGMDGTGPMGLGPMTGGGRGWCDPYSAGSWSAGSAGSPYLRPYASVYPQGYGMNYAPYAPYGGIPFAPYTPFGWGRGMGRGGGRGMGRGWRRGWW
jgi:hypothetical protein